MKALRTNELTSPLMEIIGAFAFAAVIIVGGTKSYFRRDDNRTLVHL